MWLAKDHLDPWWGRIVWGHRRIYSTHKLTSTYNLRHLTTCDYLGTLIEQPQFFVSMERPVSSPKCAYCLNGLIVLIYWCRRYLMARIILTAQARGRLSRLLKPSLQGMYKIGLSWYHQFFQAGFIILPIPMVKLLNISHNWCRITGKPIDLRTRTTQSLLAYRQANISIYIHLAL